MAIRRRPILRAAAVGVMGYKVGKTATRQAGPQAETSAPPNAAPQPQTAAAPGAPASQTERIKALAELKTLLDSGAVTQAEFDLAKKGLLEGG
jgi:hypothetical protein